MPPAMRIELSCADPKGTVEHRHEAVVIVSVRHAPRVWAALQNVRIEARLGRIAVQIGDAAILGVFPLHLFGQRVVSAFVSSCTSTLAHGSDERSLRRIA